MEGLLRGSFQHYYYSIFFWWADITFFEFLLFVYSSYLLGNLFLGIFKFRFTERYEEALYSIILGYGLYGLFGTFLAVTGLFNPVILRFFTVAIFVASIKIIAGNIRNISFPREIFKEYKFLKIILIVWLSVNFLFSLSPITGIDSLRYHLPIIYDIVNRGEATFSPEVDEYYSSMPVLAEVFYAVPVTIFGENSGFQKIGNKIAVPPEPHVFQLAQYSLLILLLGIFYFFLRDFIKDDIYILGTLFFIMGIFDFQREVLHAGYVDVFSYLYSIASSLLIIRALHDEDPSKKLWLSAALLGFGLGAKYLALVFGLINVLFILMISYLRNAGIKSIIKNSLSYGLIALAVAGFWYIKNFLVFGNPVYPMFSSADFSDSIAWFLVDRTWSNYLLFPFLFSGQWFVDDTQTSSRLLVFGCFALFYLLFIFLLFKREKIGAHIFMIFLFIEIYLTALFFMSHQARFLLPAQIMVMPGVFLLLEKSVTFFRMEKVFRWLILAACLILFTGNFHYFGVKVLYLTGVYDRTTYIRKIGGQ